MVGGPCHVCTSHEDVGHRPLRRQLRQRAQYLPLLVKLVQLHRRGESLGVGVCRRVDRSVRSFYSYVRYRRVDRSVAEVGIHVVVWCVYGQTAVVVRGVEQMDVNEGSSTKDRHSKKKR